MKKSNLVTLALITAVLASCHKSEEERKQHVYMRSDSTAVYTQAHYPSHSHNTMIWFYAFRPYGHYESGVYHRSGYYSSSISESSNIGRSATKSSVIRGGFGGGHYSVAS